MEQSYFNYNLKPGLSIDDFFVSTSNKKAYNFILNNKIDNKKILLIGPNKSGKTHLGKIWQKNNKFTKFPADFGDQKGAKQRENPEGGGARNTTGVYCTSLLCPLLDNTRRAGGPKR